MADRILWLKFDPETQQPTGEARMMTRYPTSDEAVVWTAIDVRKGDDPKAVARDLIGRRADGTLHWREPWQQRRK